jgi:hypothetical protein
MSDSFRFSDELSRLLPSNGPVTREQMLDYDANIARLPGVNYPELSASTILSGAVGR